MPVVCRRAEDRTIKQNRSRCLFLCTRQGILASSYLDDGHIRDDVSFVFKAVRFKHDN